MDSTIAPFDRETEALVGVKYFDPGHTSGACWSQDSHLVWSLPVYPPNFYCLPALLGTLQALCLKRPLKAESETQA